MSKKQGSNGTKERKILYGSESKEGKGGYARISLSFAAFF